LCLKYCAIFVTHTLVPSFSQNMYPILHICTNSSWKAKPIKGIEIGTYVHGSKQERIVAKFLLDTYTTWFHRIVENSLKVQHILTLLKVSDFHNMKLPIYWCKFPKRYCKGIWHQTFLKFFISFTNLKKIETNKHYSWHVHGSVCLLI